MGSTERFELDIWKGLAGQHKSVSHDRWHIDRVLQFASQLQSMYGGDPDVVTAAVLLHDLGRSVPALPGKASAEESVVRARCILQQIGFPVAKTEHVLTAIDEHDQPEVRPSSIEGRILKDADFLAGFGAWGVLRVGMWAGESGRSVPYVLSSLDAGMTRRLNGLEFIESKRWARTQMLFSRLFLAQLDKPPDLLSSQRSGRYIVLEGISGAGKDTQAGLLQARLEAMGKDAVRVYEPSDVYWEFRELWEKEHDEALDDPVIRRHLLMADRYKLIHEKVKPALELGSTVLTVRSLVSFLVYQCVDEQDSAAAAFAHQYVPTLDLVILYDLEANEALRRIRSRRKSRSRYEKAEILDTHRQRYLAMVDSGFFGDRIKVLDASETIDRVAEKTWKAVRPVLGL